MYGEGGAGTDRLPVVIIGPFVAELACEDDDETECEGPGGEKPGNGKLLCHRPVACGLCEVWFDFAL